MRILVVEDEHDLAEALAVGLRREGYAVDLAGDEGELLEDLAFTDTQQAVEHRGHDDSS